MKMNVQNSTVVSDITQEIEGIVHAVFYDQDDEAET